MEKKTKLWKAAIKHFNKPSTIVYGMNAKDIIENYPRNPIEGEIEYAGEFTYKEVMKLVMDIDV